MAWRGGQARGAKGELKEAMEARLEVIAAPLERLYVEERLGERLATLGEDTLGATVALDDAGLLRIALADLLP